ncbi:MAG: 2-phosphosulfolactate phosphatase [Bacteroidales bacterium]|nr:2-phosphosulfolactate phosphatase [Bacteroidales bacterium]
MREIEVVLSMPLFHHRMVRKNSIVVVIDVLRSTTSIIAALDFGVKSIIPVSSKAEAEVMKHEGYLLAAEENGGKLDFADYGKSANHFWQEELKDQEIVYSTESGTKAFRLTREEADKVVIGAFPNLSALAVYLADQDKNIVLVCAGHKNLPALEDQLFAGALGNKLMQSGLFTSRCDSLSASIDLWDKAKSDIFDYAKKLAHRKSLPNLLTEEVLKYTFTCDSTKMIPILHFNHITGFKYNK